MAFHAAHPEVYAAVVRFAREVRGRGFKRFGMRAIWERARWFLAIESEEGEYRLNDNFISRYARLVMQQEPDLVDFFEVRELRA